MNNEYITVPVTIDFDQNNPIGSLTTRKDAIPKQPNFCFSIAFKSNDCELSEDGKTLVHYDIDLIAVSLMPDEQYVAYLESTNELS